MSALVENLPPESATHADQVWSRELETVTALLERLDYWGVQHAGLMNADRRRLPKPLRVERPWERAERARRRRENRGIDLGAIDRFFKQTG